MAIISDDVNIIIDSVDYSNFIDNYSESGGEREYDILKMKGNNYKRTEIGKTNYEVTLNVRVDDATFKTIFDKTTPFDIVVTGSNTSTGSLLTITYSQMQPTQFQIQERVNDIMQATLIYTAQPYFGGSDTRTVE